MLPELGPVVTLLLLLLASQVNYALELVNCGRPLGLENGVIPDKDISASSAHDSSSVGPQFGRLRHDKNGGAWCPKHTVSNDGHEYMEVNLHDLHIVTGVQLQGRFGNGLGQEYAEQIVVDFWRPGFTKWRRWKGRNGKEIVPGNINTYTVADQRFDPPIIGSKVRIIPYSEIARTVCMRIELMGCLYEEGLVSYSMPQGNIKTFDTSHSLDLTDKTYDGIQEDGILTGGLGQLTDGQVGADNFKMDAKSRAKGYEWVGWRNDSFPYGKPVEMVFEFDRVRNFTAMHLHINNYYTKDIQVFSHANVYLSLGGRQFSLEPIQFTYMPDTIMEKARNVTIKLHHKQAKFLKLQMYFSSQWLLISEIYFQAVIVPEGFIEDMDEEENFIPVEENTKEDPLQRDEFHIRSDHMHKKYTGLASKKDSSDDKPLVGLLIFLLGGVIVILVAAIGFIILRHRRLKSTATNSVLSDSFVPTKNLNMKDLEMRVANGHVYGQVTMDEGEKTGQGVEGDIMYQEPFSRQTATCYTDSDLRLQAEYAVPLTSGYSSASVPISTPSRSLPPPLFFPPPPEKYYAATEICANGGASTPRSLPPTSPGSVSSKSARSGSSYEGRSPKRSPGKSQRSLEVPLTPLQSFPPDLMRLLDRVGQGQFAQLELCEVTQYPEWVSDHCKNCKLVIRKSLRHNVPAPVRQDFTDEALTHWRMRDPNIVQLLGANLTSDLLHVVYEFCQFGDLNQFLQEHIAESTSPRPPNAKTLSYGCLLYMATQIASGMKYLESINFVHKDLAARNCLVYPGYSIKISNYGIVRSVYAADYADLGGESALPIRWMAWESIVKGKFSSKSDAWSFAVTLWEILTFAREQPYEDFSDQRVVEHVSHFARSTAKHIMLPQPINCPKEIFDLMCECWQKHDADRPNFREIHLFLQRKNLGYNPETN
uniref:Discoidin domain-containing receptor 2 n=1 Tax=Cacopsylla melanoneura TaxID=428564 RepID=A0A8D8YYZ7_9HEMI